MSKLGAYIETIKTQINKLRSILTAKSGHNCAATPLASCMDILDSLEVTNPKYISYKRPYWYPDIESILDNAPNITVNNIEYKPMYIALCNNYNSTLNYYSSSSYTSTDPNYFTSWGGDAYIFSDDIDNDVNNISSTTLQIGTTISHTWDSSKDILDPDGSTGVRWVIVYSSPNRNISCWQGYYKTSSVIEYVLKQGEYTKFGDSSYGDNNILKYIKIGKDAHIRANGVFYKYRDLIEIHNEGFLEVLEFSFNYCMSLKTILNSGKFTSKSPSWTYCHSLDSIEFTDDIPVSLNTMYINKLTINKKDINFSQYYLGSLHTLELINTETITGNLVYQSDYSLSYVKIPSTLKSWTGSSQQTLAYCTYIELFNNFDVSGINFTGARPKYEKWLKDLCLWLKDRTGEEAGTMIIGATNIDNASNIYLTFNPNNKRDITFDGVTSETAGAISITEFITNQLNWTLS